MAKPSRPTYAQLAKIRNPEYDLDYWRELCALYEGGRRLLRDKKLLQCLLPKNFGEEEFVYEQRLKSACYLNYFGMIVDYIVSSVGSSPISLKFNPENVDEYYHRLMTDVTPPENQKESFNQMLRCVLQQALVLRSAWILVDLPAKDGREIRTRAEEEASGMMDAYICHLDAEDVCDWEMDEDGDEFEWALVRCIVSHRPTLASKRDSITEKYTYYTRDEWQRYSFTYGCYKDGTPKLPTDSTLAVLEAEGKHSFGKVPLLRFCLPNGLWAGNKIANLSSSHLNKRSAFDWGAKRTMFQFLAASLGPTEVMNPITQDPDRAVKQKIGPGRMLVGGENDKFYYVSPDAAPFKVALEDMENLRTEIFRVMHQMAMSQDNSSAAALKRSGESKKMDAASTVVVLKGLGELLREFAEEVVELISRGRGEYGSFEVEAEGADEYEDVALESLVEEAATVHTNLKPRSAHFIKKYDLKVYKRLLGTDLTDEDIEIMSQELDSNVTNEDILMGAGSDMGMLPNKVGSSDPTQPGTAGSNNSSQSGDGGSTNSGVNSPSSNISQRAGDPNAAVAQKVHEQLSEDFDPALLGWVLAAKWTGPIDVPLDQVDFSNRANWRASDDPEDVQKHVGLIQEGKSDPIIMVNEPNNEKLIVVDGHHRLLAAEKLSQPVKAYVADVQGENGPWAHMHEVARTNGSMKTDEKEMVDALRESGMSKK